MKFVVVARWIRGVGFQFYSRWLETYLLLDLYSPSTNSSSFSDGLFEKFLWSQALFTSMNWFIYIHIMFEPSAISLSCLACGSLKFQVISENGLTISFNELWNLVSLISYTPFQTWFIFWCLCRQTVNCLSRVWWQLVFFADIKNDKLTLYLAAEHSKTNSECIIQCQAYSLNSWVGMEGLYTC